MHLLGSLQKERTYSFCGTIEYMAPEIIRGKAGHGKVRRETGRGCIVTSQSLLLHYFSSSVRRLVESGDPDV